MENSGEQEDDHGSGWLEVKKKHRSSSKFSLQGWVDGFSGKPSSRRTQPVVNEKVRKSHGFQSTVADNVPVSSKEGVDYSGISVANQDIECACTTASSSSSTEVIATSITNASGINEEIPQKDSPVMMHSIKWGVCDHGDLRFSEKSVSAHIKFGDIDSDTLTVNGTVENANSMISPRSLSTQVQANKLVGMFENIDEETHQMHSLTPRTLEKNCKELNETSSKNMDMQSEGGRVVDETGNLSNCKETHHELANSVVGDPLVFNGPVKEQIGVPDESKVGDLKNSTETIADDGSVTLVISQKNNVVAGRSSTETHAESSIANSVEERKGSQDDVISDDMSRAKMTVDLSGVGDSGESKERFRQRLWCFLFENLSRAVDELYLLCELECDLEQVKEAILVLHEAESDFQELNARVQEFENIRKSSPQLVDGFSVTTRTDHRRPHALSWEVRRMTTSPHRAEILSSSLEAFKKIQHERANMNKTTGIPDGHHPTAGATKSAGASDVTTNAKNPVMKQMKKNTESGRSSKASIAQNGLVSSQNSSSFDSRPSRLSLKDSSGASIHGKFKKEQVGLTSEKDKVPPMKDKMLADTTGEKNPKSIEHLKVSKKDTEKRNTSPWKSMDAWKEKRNWEDILASPFRASSRVSPSPGMSRKSAERKRILRDKLMSPEKKKRTALDLKKDAEEKHARATRIRGELENERVQKLQRSSQKLNRVNEWQAVRNMKLREGMDARHQRSVSRHEAFLAQVVRRAGDESSKVNEVRFITSLNEGNKKLMLRQKYQDSELRRAEKLQVIKSKQREDMAREEAVLERRKLLEAEKLQRLAEIQRKKEEAQVRREEERRLSSVAREAKAIDQLRRKEIRVKAQQEEAELLAQKLAEKLRESEQRRKFYLEQIRERASINFRDQSPLLRRSVNKEAQGRSAPTTNGEDIQTSSISGSEVTIANGNTALQHSLKRRIKKIRQKLMALKYEFSEPPITIENSGIGYRTAVGNARAKIGRWLQELQKLRQARKERVAIGLITADMVKYLEGKDPELLASRQAGLLDFIAAALPASHTSKPKACQVTVYFIRVLRTVLSLPANRGYFLSQNLLPPIIPILSAALENYIKIAASLNGTGGINSLLSKTTVENFESVTEFLDGVLWTVTVIIGHVSSDERQLQMQDGLLELLVAYQVIHRLRDLFALYDRPQVEGSPFPSSILLSINMLMVLTTRPRTISSIDWESFPDANKPGQDPETTLLDSTVEFSFVNNYNGDCRPPLSVPNCSIVTHLPEVPEDRPLVESCKTSKHDEQSSAIESNGVIHDTKETSPTEKSRKNVNYARSSEPQKDEKSSPNSSLQVEQKNENTSSLKQPLAFLLSAISETGLVSLPSLLTAVLLQANNRLSSEQVSSVLPSNFEEVAAGVLKVLNNLALIDITLMQKMLARPDLQMEFFHLMSFLLSHCTNNWKVAGDPVGLLLLECLSLLGYFALFHTGNQAVLRWGKSPTILHKVCDLPFVFFSDPDLMPVLCGTVVAACYGCEQNKGLVQQELSMDMLLSLLKSCKNSSPVVQPNSTRDKSPIEHSRDNTHLSFESKKTQADTPLKASRYNAKSGIVSSGKVGSTGNSSRITKTRNPRESKTIKGFEDESSKQNLPISENSDILMLHCRFPDSFIDKAEQFFSACSINLEDEA